MLGKFPWILGIYLLMINHGINFTKYNNTTHVNNTLNKILSHGVWRNQQSQRGVLICIKIIPTSTSLPAFNYEDKLIMTEKKSASNTQENRFITTSQFLPVIF